MNENKQIAITIMQQIDESYSRTQLKTPNGKIHKISALKILGSHNFLYDKNYLQFGVKGNKRINKVVIKLNSMDTYDIELWNCRILERDPYIINDKIKEFNDIYNDQLGDLLIEELVLK